MINLVVFLPYVQDGLLGKKAQIMVVLGDIHHLSLYCTVDTRLRTDEGTEQVCQEKAEDIAKILTNMNEKGNLNNNQQAFIRRKQSTLARLDNPFPRPSKPCYQEVSLIFL